MYLLWGLVTHFVLFFFHRFLCFLTNIIKEVFWFHSHLRIDLVNGPVPGPTSSTRRGPSTRAIVLVMALESAGDDGHTEPVLRKLRMASVRKSSTGRSC